MKRPLTALVACASLCACGSPFAPPNLVDRPRVVAVLADPAVTFPGTEVSLRALLAGAPEGAERSLVWRVCVEGNNPPDALMTPTEPAQDCIEGRLLDVLPPTVGAETSVRITAQQSELFRWIAATIPPEAPIELGLLNAMRNGVRLVVTVHGTVAGVEVRAYKRVIVTLGVANYPEAYLPAFSLGERRYVPDPSDPLRCVPADASQPALRRGERVSMVVPFGDTPPGYTTQTYLHYATAGTFENTEDSARISPWTAPNQQGDTQHWLVAQSGRGSGTGPFTPSFAACRFVVPVE